MTDIKTIMKSSMVTNYRGQLNTFHQRNMTRAPTAPSFRDETDYNAGPGKVVFKQKCVFTVDNRVFTTIGENKTKKLATREAAEKMVTTLKSKVHGFWPDAPAVKKKTKRKTLPGARLHQDLNENTSIAILNQFVQRNATRAPLPPRFKFEMEGTTPQNTVYKVTCSLEIDGIQRKATAEGKTKKEVKQQSALKLCRQLGDQIFIATSVKPPKRRKFYGGSSYGYGGSSSYSTTEDRNPYSTSNASYTGSSSYSSKYYGSY